MGDREDRAYLGRTGEVTAYLGDRQDRAKLGWFTGRTGHKGVTGRGSRPGASWRAEVRGGKARALSSRPGSSTWCRDMGWG